MGKQLFVKRTHTKGKFAVETGFKAGELVMRVRRDGNSTPMPLSYDEAYDLADALDAALDQQERDPLL